VLVAEKSCDAIAAFRKKIHRTSNNKIVFIDETALKLNESEKSTIALPGESTYTIVEDDSSYSARYDMIGACSANQTFPPIIFSPEDRKRANVKGINSKMFIKYIEDILAQAIGVTDEYPIIVVCDRSTIHSPDKMIETFHLSGAQNVIQVLLMPSKAAKRLSPLDNGIFGYWKQECRKKGQIKKNNIQHIMTSVWNNLSSQFLSSCYNHCLLGRRQNVYDDCPLPQTHTHP